MLDDATGMQSAQTSIWEILQDKWLDFYNVNSKKKEGGWEWGNSEIKKDLKDLATNWCR